MSRASRAAAVAATAAALALVVGCGKKAAPMAPVPRGPLPPKQVTVRQVGDRILARFDVPGPRGDRPSQQPVRAELVRVEYPPGVAAPAGPEAFRRRGEVVASLDGNPLQPGSRPTLVDGSVALAGADSAVGSTLRYGVRVRDRRGRPSPLVVATDLVPIVPPPPPRDLSAVATAEGVRLSWSAPAVPGGEGGARFNVYRGPAGGAVAEQPLNPAPVPAAEFLDTSVETGQAYRYLVRAVGADGTPYRESADSPAVEVRAVDLFPPAAPTGLVAVQEGLAVRLFWNPNQERDLAGYRVYRRPDGGAWTEIGPDPVRDTLYLDRDVRIGAALTYRVTAIDAATPPNESTPSAEVRVVLAPEPTRGSGTEE